MLTEQVEDYIKQLIPGRQELFIEMEEYAREHKVPIMELIGIESMLQILRIKQPKKILEVGTAIGYSALRMAHALPDASVVTIERDDIRISAAKTFIEKSGLKKQIHLIEGDAFEVEDQVKQFAPYDCLFIDAAKGQYKRFFELFSPYLEDHGMIVVDNVLFKGYVCEEEITNRRTRSLVKKIRNFNKWLMSLGDYDSAILPVGDGIAISIKR